MVSDEMMTTITLREVVVQKKKNATQELAGGTLPGQNICSCYLLDKNREETCGDSLSLATRNTSHHITTNYCICAYIEPKHFQDIIC